MWYLKTRVGVFWVVPVREAKSRYILGINDEGLAFYTDVEQAALDVHNQTTGYLKWDIERMPEVPEHITEWVEGEPKEWSKHSLK
jgi:hypothetical protein